MNSPPFFIATATPQGTDIVSGYPAVEQAFREMIVSALAREMDFNDGGVNFSGHMKIPTLSTASRDAITDWVVGSFVFNTDSTPAAIQRVASIGPVVWENISSASLAAGDSLLQIEFYSGVY